MRLLYTLKQEIYLIMSIRFEYLSKSEVLLPCAAVWRLYLQGPPRKVDRVVQILQGEQHPSKVQKDLKIRIELCSKTYAVFNPGANKVNTV